MTRQHATRISIARRLRLSADRFAAAAALQDPNLLLQLQAAQSDAERPTNPPRSSTPSAAARRGYRLAAISPFPAQ
jgi:hypothetical protein